MGALASSYSREQLFGLGPQRNYTGESLRRIAFPLGGIGTGSLSLSGWGALVDWEIFNRPNKGTYLPFTFFSLWAKQDGMSPLTRVLQGPPMPPFDGSGASNEGGLGHGVPYDSGAGLPHMRSCSFAGEYPFAWISFTDPELPLDVIMEAYNPFIPLNPDDSGLPAAIFRFTLHNAGLKPVLATLAANLYNAVGYRGGTLDGSGMGGNVNAPVHEEGLTGLLMTSQRYAPGDHRFGSMALTTPWPEVTWQSAWLRAGWFDTLQAFWDEFSALGVLAERTYGPSDDGKSDVGTIGLRVRLEPEETAVLPVYITWHFPNFVKYWQRPCPGQVCPDEQKPVWQNHYATQFSDALEVARYVAKNADRLHEESSRFHDALYSSTLPPYVIDAVASNASILKTTTCIRLTDGRFYAFEGCNPSSGCCEGSCTHVWNYAQTLAFLFPSLERSMRDSDYTYNQLDDGRMCFRLQLPLGSPPNDFFPAADGQLGGVLKVYRDWKLSGHTDWLRGLWPRVKKALAFAWKEWDVDRDGVMEGVQHNTYDIEFWGPNPMMGSLYLGALRAAEEIARALGEEDQAREYRRLYESGHAKLSADLFNGEYFVQRVDPLAHLVAHADLSKSIGGQTPGDPKYQCGSGCLSDQIIGQWLAHLVGLGHVLEPEQVQSALRSVFKHNWRLDFYHHPNCQRVFAVNDEHGLLLCSWPHGGRPAFPFPYSDEVWTGIEYQVASHMIYEGLLDEGLAIVRGLRERYDGVRRNPWNEMECGNHYARALASWSLLTALSGFSFDLTRGAIGFSPRLEGPVFRTFWSVASGWGTYQQQQTKTAIQVSLRLQYGSLSLSELSIGRVDVADSWRASARRNGNSVSVALQSGPRLTFDPSVLLTNGDELTIELSPAGAVL